MNGILTILSVFRNFYYIFSINKQLWRKTNEKKKIFVKIIFDKSCIVSYNVRWNRAVLSRGMSPKGITVRKVRAP